MTGGCGRECALIPLVGRDEANEMSVRVGVVSSHHAAMRLKKFVANNYSVRAKHALGL